MGSGKPLIEPATAESIVAKRGTTTIDGAGDGSTVVDAGLTEANDYWNDMTLLILSGACDGQSRDITDFAGGTLTVSPVFANQILLGVRYFILPIKPSAAEVEDLKGTGFIKDTDSLVNVSHEAGAKGTDNIYDQTNKLAGEAIDEDTTTKNWNTAVDSPDGAGGIVCTVGSAATKTKIHSLLIDVSALTDTAVIDVKLFMKINGVQQKVYDTEFTIGTDPDGLWVINGTLGIHDILTVAVYSDTNESKAIGYTIMTEAM